MKDTIEKLIEFSQKYGVMPSISFELECGNVWIKITLKRNKKAIDKLFYYVPVGEGTIENFRFYNKFFDEEILDMIRMLEADELDEAVANGTVLPKGHGRLIDADAVLEEPIGNTYKDIDIAETIVEADKESENKNEPDKRTNYSR